LYKNFTIKAYNYYYTQAAAPVKEENPFLVDDAGALSGDKSSSNRVAGPPARPPPPKTSLSYASPAKSAFDDLNDSIRSALASGSPHKSSGGFRSVEHGLGQQQHVAGMMYSSSSFQQHAFAPQQSQTMHSSPVKGNVQSVSSNNGGGSQIY
jgi:hypothetical protein